MGFAARLAFAVVVLSFAAPRSSALDGRLLDHDGAPVPGVRVTVIGVPNLIAVTGADGRFTLTPDPAPPFEILVTTADGVALRPLVIRELPVTGPLEVRLAPMIEESVTVISGVVPDLELPPAAAATVVGRGDIEQRRPQRLTDALEGIPGAGRLEGGASTVPSLRGMARSRTLILLDDGRVTAERRAGPSASYLDPETVEEIEVVRGPGSVAYGSDAFGGVIRAVSRTHHPGEPAAARFGLSAADDAGARGGFAEAGFCAIGGGVLVGVHAREGDDYSSPRSVVFNSSFEDRGARLAYEAAVGGGALRLLLRDDEARDVGKPATDSSVTRAYYPSEDSTRAALTFERLHPGAWSRLAASVFWSDYRLVTNRERLPAPDATRRIAQSDVDADDYGVRFDAERSFNFARVFFGLDASGRFNLHAIDRRFDYDDAGALAGVSTTVSINDARRDDVGAFAGAGWKRGRFSMNGGLRGDAVSSESTGVLGEFDERHARASGFAAVGWEAAPGLSLTAQYASGFREPLLSDRYFVGVSGRGFVIGNPQLDPETSHQCDFAFRWRPGPWNVAVFAYLYRIDDLIERYRDGEDYRFRNRGEGEIRGLELEAERRLAGALLLQLAAHRVRGELEDDGSALADIPGDAVFATLRREPVRSWWWLLRASAYARDDRPGPTEITTPGAAIFDAAAGLRITRALEIQLNARNLLDHAYPSDPDEKATLAPGRTLSLTLRGWIGGLKR